MQSLPEQPYLGLAIALARRRIKQAVTSRAEPHGLSAQQFWLLIAVAEAHGPSVHELAAARGMDDPTASRILSTLMRRDLIRTQPDPRDRRRSAVSLTPAGTALARKLKGIASEIRQAQVAGITEADLETTRAVLTRVASNMERFLEAEEVTEPRTGKRETR